MSMRDGKVRNHSMVPRKRNKDFCGISNVQGVLASIERARLVSDLRGGAGPLRGGMRVVKTALRKWQRSSDDVRSFLGAISRRCDARPSGSIARSRRKDSAVGGRQYPPPLLGAHAFACALKFARRKAF